MGLIDKLFGGSRVTEVGSPVEGDIVPIETVNDETFSQEMLGKSVAILPAEGKFHAPADGVLESLFPTGHAYAVKTEKGAEILVHIGLETVKLDGKHFTLHATQGDTVKKGDLLVEVDLDAVKNDGYDIVTPILILNSDDYAQIEKKEGHVSVQDPIMLLTDK